MKSNHNYQNWWNNLTTAQQLETDPDRVFLETAQAEQQYALSPEEQAKWKKSQESPELPQAQVTPSRCPSPDVTLEMLDDRPMLANAPLAPVIEEEAVEEELSEVEVNDHMPDPNDFFYSVHPESRPRERHALPHQLVHVTSKNWFGTHNDAEYLSTDELADEMEIHKDLIQYFVMYKEVAPSTGHEHYHSLLILHSMKRAHTAIDIDPRGSWEKCTGTALQAFKYVSKEGQLHFEYGQAPTAIQRYKEALAPEQRKRQHPTKAEEQWKEMLDKAKRGDETIRDEKLYARYGSYFDRILAHAHKDEIYPGELTQKNKWIWGPTGTGKTRCVWEDAVAQEKRVFVKNCNKWWDGYEGQEIVLIDDAGENIKVLAQHIKNWADRYPFTAEVKGGTRRINTSEFKLIITSNYSIDQLFNETDAEAIKRRFEVVYME